VLDLACGHGLIAHLLLLLDDTSPDAVAADSRLPDSARKVRDALVLAWPTDRPHAQRALHVIELGSVAVGFLAWRFRRLVWTPVQRTALWLLVVELVVALLGPYRTDIYERWHVARVAYLAGFGVLAVAQLLARRDRG